MRTQVAIIGAGLIGRSWAIVFARSGFQVKLWDQFPHQTAAALTFIAERLPLFGRYLLGFEVASVVLLVAAVVTFPVFRMLTEAVNPALAAAAERARGIGFRDQFPRRHGGLIVNLRLRHPASRAFWIWLRPGFL